MSSGGSGKRKTEAFTSVGPSPAYPLPANLSVLSILVVIGMRAIDSKPDKFAGRGEPEFKRSGFGRTRTQALAGTRTRTRKDRDERTNFRS
jgi:hypothetical protein